MGMEKFNQNILNVIGNTPIVKLQNVANHVESEIYVKLEYMNPGGSIKDRIGKHMIEKAIESGELKPGGTIIEGTSGNTGVGLAMYAALHGYKCIFVLADKQSPEKISNLRAFGAKVIVCPTNVEPTDPRSYYSVSKRLSETVPNSFYVNQYDNLSNRETHYLSTGPEIFEQTDGDFDVFIAGVGTGGTISGTGKYLKEKMPNVKVVGVDCEGSILAHYHKTGEMCEAHPYVIEGIGEDIIPKNIAFDIIDDFVVVGDKESFIMTRKLLNQEGIYTGGSGGSAVVGAIRYAKKLKQPKKILVILPDSGNRYASKIYNDDWMRENRYLDSTFNVQVSEVLETLDKGKENFVSLQEVQTIQEAIDLMKDNDISQVPVYGNKDLVGVVSESNIMRPLYEGELALTDTVSVALETNFAVIDENEMLENVAEALVDHKTVLVTRKKEIVDLLTQIDLLNFMSKRRKY